MSQLGQAERSEGLLASETSAQLFSMLHFHITMLRQNVRNSSLGRTLANWLPRRVVQHGCCIFHVFTTFTINVSTDRAQMKRMRTSRRHEAADLSAFICVRLRLT